MYNNAAVLVVMVDAPVVTAFETDGSVDVCVRRGGAVVGLDRAVPVTVSTGDFNANGMNQQCLLLQVFQLF